MKNNLTQIFFLLVSALSSVQMFAADPSQPPPPPVPVPVGVPIDNGIVLLFFIALITGYFITQKIYKPKNS